MDFPYYHGFFLMTNYEKMNTFAKTVSKTLYHHLYFTFLTQCPTMLKNLAWTWELVIQLPEST